jgi:hypothetical protein
MNRPEEEIPRLYIVFNIFKVCMAGIFKWEADVLRLFGVFG